MGKVVFIVVVVSLSVLLASWLRVKHVEKIKERYSPYDE